MKWGIFSLVMAMTGILFAGRPKDRIKALYEQQECYKLQLVLANISRSYQFEQVRTEISGPGIYKVVDSQFDRSKKTAELFISTNTGTSLDDIEVMIQSLGIKEIEYRGQIIKTTMLSNFYQPVIPSEFVTKTRN